MLERLAIFLVRMRVAVIVVVAVITLVFMHFMYQLRINDNFEESIYRGGLGYEDLRRTMDKLGHDDIILVAVNCGTLQESLAESELFMPSLGERDGDLSLLAGYLVRKASVEYGTAAKRISDDAFRALEAHAWPGNVREFENVLRRAVAASGARGIIHLGDLDEKVRSHASVVPDGNDNGVNDEAGLPRTGGFSLAPSQEQMRVSGRGSI